MAQIPIVLTPLPVPVGIKAINFDQLLSLICTFIQGNISAGVSFFQQGATAPTSNQGIFFNQTDNRFENWSTALGAYVPISEQKVGNIVTTFIGGDDLPSGLVLLDGRNINSISGLTQQQKTNLETLFGANNTIPQFNALSSLTGVPAVGSFSNINNPSIKPGNGVIGNLPVDNPPTQGNVLGITNNTEQLENSTTTLQAAVAQIISFSESIVGALNNASGATVFGKVFVGYPG